MSSQKESVASRRSLLPDSIRFFGTLGNSIGIQAPTAGVTFLPALMAGVVGGAGSIAFLLALVAMLFVSYAFSVFARSTSTAGSVFVFNGRALFPLAGFATLLLLLVTYIAYAAAVFASNANIMQASFPNVPWFLLALICLFASIVIGYRALRLSAALIVLFEGIAIVLVAAVGIAVLLHGGFSGHITSPFATNHLQLSSLGLGVVLAFTGFSGFEVAATLGEESVRPKTTIPRSFVIALIASGLIYAAMSWIETLAFPSPTVLASQSVPLITIAGTYVGMPMAHLITVAALISGLGAQFACFTGATRLLFAFAREVAPHSFATRTHSRHHSPVGALAAVSAMSLIGIAVMATQKAIDAYFDLATFGADLILVVYAITVIGAMAWSIRTHQHPVRNSIIFTVGGAILCLIIWTTLTTLVAPFTWCALAAGIVLLLTLMIYIALPSMRRSVQQSALLHEA